MLQPPPRSAALPAADSGDRERRWAGAGRRTSPRASALALTRRDEMEPGRRQGTGLPHTDAVRGTAPPAGGELLEDRSCVLSSAPVPFQFHHSSSFLEVIYILHKNQRAGDLFFKEKKTPKHLAEARHDRRKSYTVRMMSSSTFQSSNKIPKQEIANYHWDQFYYSKGCFSTTEHCGLPRCDVLRWGEEHLYGQKRCLLWSSSDPGFQKQGGFM